MDVAVIAAAASFSSDAALQFDANGLPSAAAAPLLIALVLALLARVLRPETRLSDLFATHLAALFLIDAVWLVLQWLPAWLDRIDELWPVSLPLQGVAAPWIAIAVGQAMAMQARGFVRRFVVMLVSVLLIGVPLSMFDRGIALWSAAPTASNPETSGTAPSEASAPSQLHVDESLLYGENQRLEETLEQLAPRTPGRINVYFVGFAGNGEQMVFTREVTYVKNLFEQRFAGPGHTVALMNNFFTTDRVPLATATSLNETLSAVGQQMSDDDLLVLFMTSHGSRETGINVSLPPLDFEDIDPAALKEMLDQSHIRNRVIIISACYSGVFIKPLANPDTLVITAADATHTSFGCSNEADFTYFGEAYFHDALASTNSFSEAFQKALPLIEARENREGFAHSNPQMSVGSDLQDTLKRLEEQTDVADLAAHRDSGTKRAL
jgi:hypothetical protein